MTSVPFYPNTTDDTHCFQASLRSVLKYFEPDKDYLLEDLDRITNKPTDKWTWPMAGLTWLAKNTYDVVNIELFDYSRFISEGTAYTKEIWGEDTVTIQELHSDTAAAQADAARFVKSVTTEFRAPTTKDIQQYLDGGYLVMCMVNAGKLNGSESFVGHSVLIHGYDEHSLTLHDPGLPAQESRIVDFELFENAWADPNDTARNLMAIKRM